MFKKFVNWLRHPLGDDVLSLGGFSYDAPDSYIPGFDVTATAAALPHSLSLKGEVCRWHDPTYFFAGDEYWRTFQDSRRKWEQQQRFAGADLNCGHFFSLSEAGASAEAGHYGLDVSTVEMLRLRIAVEGILDLTSLEGMKMAFHAVAEGMDLCHALITEELIEIDKGGTQLTDFIGHWAASQGYRGILFIGARAIHGPGVTNASTASRWDYDLFPLYLEGYRQERDALNLVLFSGSHVTVATRTYRFGDQAECPNRYFGMTEAELETVLAGQPDYDRFDPGGQRKHMVRKIRYEARP